MRGRGAVVVFVLFIAAAPAHADPARELKDGIEAYGLGEAERAEPLLARAAAFATAARDRATAYLYLGMTQVLRNKTAQARRSFLHARIADPNIAPDRQRTSPAVLKEWDAMLASLAPKAPPPMPPPQPTQPKAPETKVTPAVDRGSLTQPEDKQAALPANVRKSNDGAPKPSPWYLKRRPWGYVSLGVAAATGILGIVFGRSANSTSDQIGAESRAGTLDVARFEALRSEVSSKALLSNVFFGVAGAAAVTGAILVILGDKRAAERRVRLVPTLGGAMLAGSF